MRTIVALLLLVSSGCSTASYLVEQAGGQLRLLQGREPIAALLRRSDLSDARRRKLQLVALAREYAFGEIGLSRTGAYTSFYDTGGRPVAYNLSAARKDSLRPKIWTFPVVGALPYLGFFRRASGVSMQRRLRAEGLDTYLRPVPAYSSLGWFDDPLFSSLLDEDPPRLVEVVLHEMTHTTVFLRGEVGFNESLAVFVGRQGTLDFFARLFGPLSRPVRAARRLFGRKQRFARLIEELHERLARLYSRSIGSAEKIRRRRAVFEWSRRRYRELFPDRAERGKFLERPLNNAVVLSYGRYLRGLRFHRAVYGCLGRDLRALVDHYRSVQRRSDAISRTAEKCGIDAPPQRM